MRIAAKKSLGQHFLFNPSAIDKILDLAKIGKDDRVLEIGPGPGTMTDRLAARVNRLVAVEMDRRFAQSLREKFSGTPKVTIVEGDFLRTNLEGLLSPDRSGWKVVANLPYNVATEMIFHLLELSTFFQGFHVMVQKEVAERIVARPGSKNYGILSIFSQLFSENRIVMRLKPGSFTPAPKVDSAVVEFKVSGGSRFPIHHLPTFESVVRAAFGQRRKTIANALKGGGFAAERILPALKETGVAPQARAETVSINEFASLANLLSEPKV